MSHPLSKLYKQGNRGLEEWQVLVEHHDSYSNVIVRWSMSGSDAVQEKTTKITKGKNIGRANATDHRTQSIFEAQSKYNKQLDKSYRPTIEEATETEEVKIRPMLAKVYADHKHKIKFPCYASKKLDGVRNLTYLQDGKVIMLSRLGKFVNTMPHIAEEVKPILEKYNGLILDGELYTHGKRFQEIISGVKRDDANESSGEIEYHIYDVFTLDSDESYEDRIGLLRDIFSLHSPKYCQLVDGFSCKSEAEIFDYHIKFLQDGYEGTMVRGADAPYKIDGRSDQLLKLKSFQDAEFEVTGFSEDKNNHVVFTLVTDAGGEFKAKPEGTDEERKEMLANAESYVGKKMTVKFFEWSTSDIPIPRFPVILREYQE